MKLTFVDAQEHSLTVEVSDEGHAERVFDQSLFNDPWIAATLRENDGQFTASFQRLNPQVDSHPSVTPEMIKDALSVRGQVRLGDELHPSDPLWLVVGYCHEVSEYLEQEYGLARISGTIMAKDLVSPICLHYWNVLPDMTIVDMTADQLQEGFDFRIIPAGHPDWYRYQPEYSCVDDLEADKGGNGFYTDEMIDFILSTAKRIEIGKHVGLREYLECEPANADLMAQLHPFVAEHLKVAIKENDSYLIKAAKVMESSFDY